jgi:hypothetical protein
MTAVGASEPNYFVANVLDSKTLEETALPFEIIANADGGASLTSNQLSIKVVCGPTSVTTFTFEAA